MIKLTKEEIEAIIISRLSELVRRIHEGETPINGKV